MPLSNIVTDHFRISSQKCINHTNRIYGLRMDARPVSGLEKRSLVVKSFPGIYQPLLVSKNPFQRHVSSSETALTSQMQVAPNKFIMGNDKVGVLLLNLGGPETLEDVQPFLFNLFADPVICLLCIILINLCFSYYFSSSLLIFFYPITLCE